jgi:hypothetical protein
MPYTVIEPTIHAMGRKSGTGVASGYGPNIQGVGVPVGGIILLLSTSCRRVMGPIQPPAQ